MWTADSLKQGEVIGVVRDFHTNSLKESITPLVMHMQPEIFYTLSLRLDHRRAQAQINQIEEVFAAQVPGQLFSYSFVDENFDKMYRSEQNLSTLLNIFAALTVFVACMGLFGLVEYHVHQRAKEISIRKVLGSGETEIIYLLLADFTRMVLIAIVIATPISYLTSHQWLITFAYKIDLQWWYFMGGGFTALLIAWMSVGALTIKAAKANPVDGLRCE
jgi:putative ABC transport system permease protein